MEIRVKQKTEHLSLVFEVQHPKSDKIIAETPISMEYTWNWEFKLASTSSDDP